MKNYIIVLLSIVLCASTINIASAKASYSSALSEAIKMYKSRNYSESYVKLNEIVKKDPSNVVAYYYLAMTSAQIGRKSEAIANYDKVISLAPNGKIGSYAKKGKTCLETPDKCNEESSDNIDSFIHSKYGTGFSNEVRSDFEKQKIENMMREMNRKDDIAPQKFREYKDFSSELPTNDEIVAALRVLQRAGFADILGNSNSDLSLLMGGQNYNNSNAAMLNLLMGGNNSSLSPQVIQSLLTNQMSTSF